jgi:ArsR family transcriptional regulator, arsenate/arsenite/antimonite-responsive transcriptional repressor
MDIDTAARCMEALGSPKRLEIVLLLVKAGPEGLPVGDIRQHLDIPGSTLSHHLLQLVGAGVIRQDREGRVLRCHPNFDQLNGLANMLFAECCTGISANAPSAQAS